MHAADLVPLLAPNLNGALIATDFDGTLAPLVADPQASRPVAGAVDALTALSERGAQIAVITGRDARTVLRLGSLDSVPGLVVAGVYGIETWRGGELTAPETPQPVQALRDRLPVALAKGDPALWIEDKRLSLVVHSRMAADPAAALAGVEAPIRRLADELGLEVHPGSSVLEVRLPGYDKASAVRRLVEGHTAALFLGDDVGDVPAFEAIRQLRAEGLPAWSVAVLASGIAEVLAAADTTVADPAAAVELLSALAQAAA